MNANGYQPLEGKVYDDNLRVGNSIISFGERNAKIILERCIRNTGNDDSYAIRLIMPWKKHYIINNSQTSYEETSLKHYEAYSKMLKSGCTISLDEKDGVASLLK